MANTLITPTAVLIVDGIWMIATVLGRKRKKSRPASGKYLVGKRSLQGKNENGYIRTRFYCCSSRVRSVILFDVVAFE